MATDDDWRPTATLETLRRRAALLGRVRDFFAGRGYWEVETPVLSADCGNDAWVEPFAVTVDGGTEHWLQTSPELAMKRLLAAGADRIFQFARCFRRDESGPRHNREFTMLEWYARDETHWQQMEFVEELVRHLLDWSAAQGRRSHDFADKLSAFRRIGYERAFQECAGVGGVTGTLAELRAAVGRVPALARHAVSADADALRNLLLAECVEPHLAKLGGVFLHAYPASQSALAEIDPGPPPTALRFELYVRGIELCNGYQELRDAEELLRRMRELNRQRERAGRPPLPEETRLLAAMRHGLPPCSGVALGFDRLAMLCLGKDDIRETIAFPDDRA